MKIELTARAKKELKNISRSHQLALKEILNEINENPSLGKPLTRELTRRFSYRVGVYRIIYKVNWKDKTIYIITAGHRATVYK